MRKKRKLLLPLIAVVLLLTFTAVTTGCDLISKRLGQVSGGAGTGAGAGHAGAGIDFGTGPDAVEKIAEATSPAVVLITTTTTSKGGDTGSLFNDQLFRRFFGDSFEFKREQEGYGSGFIISDDGYILTNEHVINKVSDISVSITGIDTPLKATVVGSDYNLDLAVLKVSAGKSLPYLKLGDSDSIQVGSLVVAIGNPYGLEHTVTVGVISAKGRPVNIEDRQYEDLLQTDASINPGNSGGPLINMRGEVVGINTAINAEARGIGFAIPTSTVSVVLNDLISGVTAARPWIGVQVRTVDEEAARYLGMAQAEGALVTGVVRGSPADKAGIKQWDVIMEFNGTKTDTSEELVAAVRAAQVGQKVQILYYREEQLDTMSITVAQRPENAQ